MSKLFLVLMGVQGAGKGVQAQFLKSEFGIPHVSTGDLFRAMKVRQDELALLIQATMNSGEVVNDHTTNVVVQDRLAQPDAVNGVLFDGYPRTIAQAEWLDNYLANLSSGLTAVLLLEVNLYIALKRAFGRFQSADGESFNIYFDNSEIEWKTFEDKDIRFPLRIEAYKKHSRQPLIRRSDDANAASVVKRIDTYVEQTLPLIDHYERKKLLCRINAEQSIDDVSLNILIELENRLQKKTV